MLWPRRLVLPGPFRRTDPSSTTCWRVLACCCRPQACRLGRGSATWRGSQKPGWRVRSRGGRAVDGGRRDQCHCGVAPGCLGCAYGGPWGAWWGSAAQWQLPGGGGGVVAGDGGGDGGGGGGGGGCLPGGRDGPVPSAGGGGGARPTTPWGGRRGGGLRRGSRSGRSCRHRRRACGVVRVAGRAAGAAARGGGGPRVRVCCVPVGVKR